MFLFSPRAAVRAAEIPHESAAVSLSPTAAIERHFADHYEALYRFLRSCGAGEGMAPSGYVSLTIDKDFPILPSAGIAVDW